MRECGGQLWAMFGGWLGGGGMRWSGAAGCLLTEEPWWMVVAPIVELLELHGTRDVRAQSWMFSLVICIYWADSSISLGRTLAGALAGWLVGWQH